VSKSTHNFNCLTMPNFEIRTHLTGRMYSGPHFFILSKGLNSGRPMTEPCPNCFVITASSEDLRESLFYMCLALKAGMYFSFYLKGSVIPFICITDARTVIKNALQNNKQQAWDQKIQKLQKIEAFETNLKLQLKTISELKIALLRF